MIAIENTLISDEVFTEKFCCDLSKCKGCCCIEGDAGAPLEKEEIEILSRYYEVIKKYMLPQGIACVEEKGLYEVCEVDHGLVTPIIDGRDCAYLTYAEDGTALCAIEKAFLAGEIDFRKPVSCHLFPIRIDAHSNYDAVNYFKWHICKPAMALGRKEGIPVFRFLKEPLIRKYGEQWYRDAEAVYANVFGDGK